MDKEKLINKVSNELVHGKNIDFTFEINEIPRTDISASELNGNDCAITFLSYLINLIFILNSTFLCNFILTLYVPKLDKGVSINIHFLSIS